MITVESIKEALKQVQDPELRCDIVSLGLIYDIRVSEEKHIEVDMTFTSMGCPAGEYILSEVQRVLNELSQTTNSIVNLVWDPPWSPDKMDPMTREELLNK